MVLSECSGRTCWGIELPKTYARRSPGTTPKMLTDSPAIAQKAPKKHRENPAIDLECQQSPTAARKISHRATTARRPGLPRTAERAASVPVQGRKMGIFGRRRSRNAAGTIPTGLAYHLPLGAAPPLKGSPRAPTAQGATCRICLSDEGELITPCACRGDSAHVHVACRARAGRGPSEPRASADALARAARRLPHDL